MPDDKNTTIPPAVMDAIRVCEEQIHDTHLSAVVRWSAVERLKILLVEHSESILAVVKDHDKPRMRTESWVAGFQANIADLINLVEVSPEEVLDRLKRLRVCYEEWTDKSVEAMIHDQVSLHQLRYKELRHKLEVAETKVKSLEGAVFLKDEWLRRVAGETSEKTVVNLVSLNGRMTVTREGGETHNFSVGRIGTSPEIMAELKKIKEALFAVSRQIETPPVQPRAEGKLDWIRICESDIPDAWYRVWVPDNTSKAYPNLILRCSAIAYGPNQKFGGWQTVHGNYVKPTHYRPLEAAIPDDPPKPTDHNGRDEVPF